jgi:hypothetical protein
VEVYLLSYYEEKGFIEASLGGNVTLGELAVFSEELMEMVEAFEGRSYSMLLDYSKARGLTSDTTIGLEELRDRCFDHGAERIVSVVPNDSAIESATAQRIQLVLEGRESYVLDPAYARFDEVAQESYVLPFARAA